MSSLGLIALTSFDYMKEFSGKNIIILKCQKKTDFDFIIFIFV